MFRGDWVPAIGLEIHAQLDTNSKIFSCDGTDFGIGDNEQVHPVSLGLPGTLPVLNEKVIQFAIKLGLALDCEIDQKSIFDRKNYFYPDLPKGYQISQSHRPICKNGKLKFYFKNEVCSIPIERAHLEEDAGKSIHSGNATLLNYNRAGIPLLEIVTTPVLKSGEQASELLKELRRILRYIEICNGNLEEGSLRCDCNVSVAKSHSEKLGTRVELKNINSFRFVEKAIEHEIDRQIDVLESGGKIVQETRLYDSVKNRTQTMRLKEESQDYRYFPDPDLLPVIILDETIEEIKTQMPERPLEKKLRFMNEFGVSHDDSSQLVEEVDVSKYFERVVVKCKNPNASASWVIVEVLREVKNRKVDVLNFIVTPEMLGEMIILIDEGKISGKMAKDIFQKMCDSGRSSLELIKEMNLTLINSEEQIDSIINELFLKFPDQATQLIGGKEKVAAFFVGLVMKETKGQAHPAVVQKILKKHIGSES